MLAQPYDWMLRFTLESSLLLILAIFFLRPLWKLAMSRPGLIIVFSRAIASFLRLLAEFPNFVYFNMLAKPKLLPPWNLVYHFGHNVSIRTMECLLHMHNLALAVNRAHGVCFPIHYQCFYAKKRRPYLTCLLLWLLALCFGIPDPFVRTWIPGYSSADTANKACMLSAGFFYVALGCRMLWNKYFKSTIANLTSEKDSIRILIICFACLFMSTLRMVALNPLADVSMGWPDVPMTIIYWANYGTNWLALCTEEILLAILVADFRKNLKQQFRAMLCCYNRGPHINQIGSSSEV